MADAPAKKKSDWYDKSAAKLAGSGTEKPSQETEAKPLATAEARAAMERQQAEHSDMMKRHQKENGALLDKYDLMMGGAGDEAGMGQGGGAQG